MINTDVVVVGAGPVGLSLALELGQQGRRCLVVELHDRIGVAPRAKNTNVRSRELMRRWGIADRLAAASPLGVDYPPNVVFATRLTGHELARFENAFYCAPVRDSRFSEHGQWIPQYKVEAALRQRVAELEGVDVRMANRLLRWTEDEQGITADLQDEATGRTWQARAAYLVGADGARSTVREQLGIEMEGTSPLGHFHNIVFRSPGLSKKHQLGPAIMYWLVNQEVPSVLAPLDAGDLWTFGCPKLAHAEADPATLIRAAVGLDIDVEVITRDEWTAHQLIARVYRSGRAFLAGDACHLHPPFGGHGMNMGIADAVDLGWKLSAVLKGWGGAALLDSYETERRQVHRRVVDESVENNSRSSQSLAVDGIEAEGADGDAVRSRVTAQILAGKPQEFFALDLVLGIRLSGSPVLPPSDTDVPTPASKSGSYVPSAQPGSLAPHAWIADGTAHGASLYDHFSLQGLTLLVTHPRARSVAEEVARAAAEVSVPLEVIAPNVPSLHELYEADMVLIRPDQIVAWRGDSAPEASQALLRAAGREENESTTTLTETSK